MQKRLHRNKLRLFVLGIDCSWRPASDWEEFDHETPIDWFLLPILLKSPISQDLEPGDFEDDSLEDLSTPSSTMDCTNLSEDPQHPPHGLRFEEEGTPGPLPPGAFESKPEEPLLSDLTKGVFQSNRRQLPATYSDYVV